MKFPLNTSPTHRMVQWNLDFEHISVAILLGCRSVPTTLEDEENCSFKFSKPSTSTFNPLNIQKSISYLSDDSDIDYDITNEGMARDCKDKNF